MRGKAPKPAEGKTMAHWARKLYESYAIMAIGGDDCFEAEVDVPYEGFTVRVIARMTHYGAGGGRLGMTACLVTRSDVFTRHPVASSTHSWRWKRGKGNYQIKVDELENFTSVFTRCVSRATKVYVRVVKMEAVERKAASLRTLMGPRFVEAAKQFALDRKVGTSLSYLNLKDLAIWDEWLSDLLRNPRSLAG